jgi:ornithine cyclodeaminase/alanine dehydrogenase-like protein (mu-crystallin family)
MRSFLSLGGTALEDLAAAKLALAAAWELKSRRRHKGKALAKRHP